MRREEAARRWLRNAEKLEFREGGGMEGWRWNKNADLRGNLEDGVNDFSLAEKAEGHLSNSTCSLTCGTTAVSFDT